GADDVDGGGDLVDDVPHGVEPLLGQQHRAHLVPGGPGPADDLLALGDEQALGGFAPAAQLHVGQARVVGQTRVAGVLAGDGIGHGWVLLQAPGPIVTTSPTTMTAGGLTSSARTVSATVARVASTRRWAAVVPSWTRATGVSGDLPWAMS